MSAFSIEKTEVEWYRRMLAMPLSQHSARHCWVQFECRISGLRYSTAALIDGAFAFGELATVDLITDALSV